MTGRVLGWIARLSPGRYKKQAEQAERGLKAAEEKLAKAQKQDEKVDQIVAAHRRDRAENHYAERVRRAYAAADRRTT